MRLIDADELFKRMESTGWWNNCDRDDIAEELVLSAPTIDAVEVVRCKDCKWQQTCGYISTKSVSERKNWFCADGKRKE